MARKLKLSFVPAIGQWKKVIKGKQHYFGAGKNKSDMASYEKALAKYEAHLTDNAADEKRQFIERKQKQWAMIMEPYANSPTVPTIALNRPSYFDDEQWAEIIGEDKLAALSAPRPSLPQKTETIGHYLDEYIAEQQRRYEHGLKFPNAPKEERVGGQRFIGYRYNAEKMKKVWGESIPLPTTEEEIGRMMIQFRNTQRDLLTKGEITASTFNERIKTLRHFVGWMQFNYIIHSLPRNVKVICSKYKLTESSARAIDVSLIKKIWAESSDRLKLYIALGLNCGFYVSDIANLPATAIQGEYLICDRHKTGVPTRFKLWAITQILLKKFAKKQGLALLARDGERPLLVINPNAPKSKRWCEIENDLAALIKRLGIKGVSFSNFRDTSSTRIESINPQLTDIFNGHKDERMAVYYVDKENIDADKLFAPLYAALAELDKFYGLSL